MALFDSLGTVFNSRYKATVIVSLAVSTQTWQTASQTPYDSKSCAMQPRYAAVARQNCFPFFSTVRLEVLSSTDYVTSNIYISLNSNSRNIANICLESFTVYLHVISWPYVDIVSRNALYKCTILTYLLTYLPAEHAASHATANFKKNSVGIANTCRDRSR